MAHNLATKRAFADHLDELRGRLFWCGACLVIFSLIGYFLHSQILALLTEPLHQTIYYTSPTGGFDLAFKASLLFGLIASLPFFIYQVVKFAEPAMAPKHRHVVLAFSLFSLILMLGGVGFAYIVGLPATLKFLGEFGTVNIKPLITTDQYFSFVAIYLLCFGILFQLPLVMLLINFITPLKASTLFKKEGYVIAVSFIFGAAVAPTPDVVSMTIMALPPIILYNLAVMVLWFVRPRRSNNVSGSIAS